MNKNSEFTLAYMTTVLVALLVITIAAIGGIIDDILYQHGIWHAHYVQRIVEMYSNYISLTIATVERTLIAQGFNEVAVQGSVTLCFSITVFYAMTIINYVGIKIVSMPVRERDPVMRLARA